MKSSSTKKGRPVKETDGFDALCEWIETEGELHTLEDLRNQLICITGSKDVYTTTSIKRKLEKKYGTDISFNEVSGRCNVVCLSNIAKHIINDLWYENRNKDVESEAERIVKTAAKLILSEIRSQYFDCDNYPSKEDIQDGEKNLNCLTPNLKMFMQLCVRSSIQQASIGQCLMHAIRPRSMLPPVLFGLTVELDHVFRSRWLLDHLAKLAFCMGSKEATRYKQSVVENESASDWLKRNMAGSFHHWIADNADHNMRTLDGKGRFHAIAVIVATTGRNVNEKNLPKIPRIKLKTVSTLMEKKNIPILRYIRPNVGGLAKIFLGTIDELKTN